MGIASKQLLCIGDLNADITVTPHASISVGSDTTGSVAMSGGGSAANVAASALVSGAATRFVGVVGDDPLGDFLVGELEGHGVEVGVIRRPGAPSRAIAAIVDDRGERSMVSALDTACVLTALDVDAAWFADTNWLHLTGYSYFAAPGVFARLVEMANEHSMPWSIDPSSVAMLESHCERVEVIDAFTGASIMFPNSDEALWLSGADDPRVAAELLLDIAETVVVTDGERGAIVACRGAETLAVGAVPTTVINTLGCGDAFAGGFLAGRLAGLSNLESAQRAALTASTIAGMSTSR